jgi:transposase InsO family protein
MPWKECDAVSLRRELVTFMSAEGANVAALCRRFAVSRKTAYKWLARSRDADADADADADPLADRSRRPRASPGRTADAVEQAVLAIRAAHPAWGPRKVRRVLQNRGEIPPADVPAASTICAILRRHGRVDPASSAAHAPVTRFERPAPNDLWQMDFKGDVATLDGRRCCPLTVLDDHSRFNVVLAACADQRTATVRRHLTDAFRRYGLPAEILCDNGTPWAVARAIGGHTTLTVWLLRLDVPVSHGRVYHPQTQGKEERFHRTLAAEVLTAGRPFADAAAVQAALDPWRDVYNHERPHEACGLGVPAGRYRPSPRAFPETLPPIEYAPGEHVRRVNPVGQLSFRGRVYRVCQAFGGHAVALRPTARVDGVYDVCFGRHRIAVIDERDGSSRTC